MLGLLLLGPPVPPRLVPLLSLEAAPPAAAVFARIVIHDGTIATMCRYLAGYCLLMVLAQGRLIPSYRRLRFAPRGQLHEAISVVLGVRGSRFVRRGGGT
jgi:hypothetical protein